MRTTTPMGCGGCGGDQFTIANRHEKDDGGPTLSGNYPGHLIVTCTGCQSRSTISVTAPQLNIEWYDGGSDLGVLARKRS